MTLKPITRYCGKTVRDRS